ncbi:MAG: PAS domain-containing protein, partial [Candidatus Cloacimonadota bacterium]
MKDILTSQEREILVQELETLLQEIASEQEMEALNRVKCLQRLRQLEQLLGLEPDYKAMVESSSDTIATFDSEGRFLYVSPNWPKVLGHEAKVIQGTNIFNGRFHPEDNPICQKALKDVFETGVRCKAVEYRIQNSKGEWLWHVASLSPIKDINGKTKAVIAVARDNHAHKLRDIQIWEDEARFRALLDTMQESVLYVNNEDDMLYVNQSCCDTFGYSREELLGRKGFEMLIVEEDHDIIRNKNQERERGVKDKYEVRGRKKNGEMMWMHVSGAPL